MKKKTGPPADLPPRPSEWSREQFQANWFVLLEEIAKENDSPAPPRRIRHQVERTPAFRDILAGWNEMSGTARLDAWKRLLASADSASTEILPACVQCGECCRRGSPVLLLEDREILRSGKIPWNQLIALRRGEPVRSPFDEKPFVLAEERIKVREKEGSGECVFLDADSNRCAIYSDRPLQCRAQACWDPGPARELANQPPLLRKHIFEGVDLLLEIIDEHEARCGFDSLVKAFETLQRDSGQSAGETLRLIAYEDHFRQFVSEKFSIPRENRELVFGRSFARLSVLFGCRVAQEPGGGLSLVPDEGNEKSGRCDFDTEISVSNPKPETAP